MLYEHRHALIEGGSAGDGGSIELLPKSAGKLDRALVERAAGDIRDALTKTMARGVDEVGQYLLRTFYNDDPGAYFASNPNKHASLAALLERCESLELPVRRTFLANALRIAAMGKRLPKKAMFHQLPASHRVELLRLRAPESVERLAAKAVTARLTVQKLRALVQKESERGRESSTRGRKPTPRVLRALDACVRALNSEDTGRLVVRRSDLATLSEEQQEAARASLALLQKRVEELRRLFN